MRRFHWLMLILSLTFVAGCGDSAPAPQADVDPELVQREQKLAESRAEFDWDSWKSIPVLHDGRVKPIDSFARETCLLVTAGRRWEHPETGVRYQPYELMFAWIADPDRWSEELVIRCEYRPLRELLQTGLVQQETSNTLPGDAANMQFEPIGNESMKPASLQVGVYVGEDQVAQLSVTEADDGKLSYTVRPVSREAAPSAWSFDEKSRVVSLEWSAAPAGEVQCVYSYEFTRDDLPEKGLYVAANDLIDWKVWRDNRRFQYRCRELEEHIRAIRQGRAQGEKKIGDTPEEQALNEKIQELEMHLQAFIAAAEARNIYIVPGFDPRTLAKQLNTDSDLQPWIALGSLLRIKEWRTEVKPDPSIAAAMATDPADVVDSLILHGLERLSRELNVDRSYTELKSLHERSMNSGILPPSAYPEENIAQLAVAQEFRSELQGRMEDIEPAFDKLRKAYLAGDRTAFDAGMQTLTRKITQLADLTGEVRTKMNPPERDDLDFGKFASAVWSKFQPLELSERQISFSEYPGMDSTSVELKYNRAKPFERAWIFFLIATIVVLLSYVTRATRLVYLGGIALGFFAIVYSAWGFMLRIQIAGRAPVTNMYETVVWVAFVVAVLGTVFALSPVYGSGLAWSWKLCGLPIQLRRDEQGRIRGLQPTSLGVEDQNRILATAMHPMQAIMSLLRISMAAGIVWFLTQSNTSFRIITLLPDLQGATSISDMPWGRFSTWVVGISTVLISAWIVPRAALCLLLGTLTAVTEAFREESEDVWQQLLRRRFFMFPAMLVACLGMMLAHFVGISSPEILNPEIGSITAVLRNNYWLTIHVLTIVSSYGAGALAWGLGNLALCYYLFGRYESDASRLQASGDDRVIDRLKRTGESLKLGRLGSTLKAGMQGFGSGDEQLMSARVRPPRESATLASYSYRVMQVAVLLLAAGTILGGLWADVSWGRFWDWDPKEVWALVSLLAYMVVLHGRFAGWVGTFGTNVGSVVCFMAIIMSWYGVNFVLPMVHGWLQGTNQPAEVGLHSYATGAGGLGYVATGVVLNLAFVVAALGRFVAETKLGMGQPNRPGTPDQEVGAEAPQEEEPAVV